VKCDWCGKRIWFWQSVVFLKVVDDGEKERGVYHKGCFVEKYGMRELPSV